MPKLPLKRNESLPQDEMPVIPRSDAAIFAVAKALHRIADQFVRYNNANEPPVVEVGEAEAFRASYEREPEGARELHEFLTGAESRQRRPQGKADGGGKKAPRSGRGGN